MNMPTLFFFLKHTQICVHLSKSTINEMDIIYSVEWRSHCILGIAIYISVLLLENFFGTDNFLIKLYFLSVG